MTPREYTQALATAHLIAGMVRGLPLEEMQRHAPCCGPERAVVDALRTAQAAINAAYPTMEVHRA